MPVEKARHRAGYVMLALAALLIIVNIALALKLSELIHTNHNACLAGNVFRSDGRLLLRRAGYADKANNPALADRPCDDLYNRSLFSWL